MKSLYLLTPITVTAQEWIEKNVHIETWQRLGTSVAIEHGFIADVFRGLIESGHEPSTDFQIE